MSVHVTSWVLKHSKAHLGDRLVLLVLADHAKDDGTYAWPSVETIGHEAHLSTRQARRCLRNLEESKAIVCTGKSRNGTNIYSVIMSPGQIVPRTNRAEARNDLSAEPSVVQPSDTSLAPTARKRARDEIWDALEVIFGKPTTRTAETRRGKVVSSLRRAGATPDEVFARAKRWALHFDQATLTDLALEKHWDTLPRKPLRRTA